MELEILKTDEVCKLLRISKHAIFQAVADGRLPVLKLSPRAWRFKRADVLNLFQREAGHDLDAVRRNRAGVVDVDRRRRGPIQYRRRVANSPSGKQVTVDGVARPVVE